jgi:hypothetical protein
MNKGEKMKTVQLRLNRDLGGEKAGTVLTLEADTNKTIIKRFWRRRLKDAEIDGCVEIVKAERKKGVE